MKTVFLLLVCCALNLVQRAHAFCSEPQPRLVCAEYSASKIVVEATLLKIDNVLYENDPGAVIGRYYTLRVDRVFRGEAEHTLRVYEGNDSGRASFDWKVGRQYVLFLFDSREKPSERVLALDGCGNSGPLRHAGSVLREIQQMNSNSQSASITGVVSVSTLSAPIPDVEVLARGSDRTYKATTDRKGRFRIEVPSGTYTVEPVQPPLTFEASELSYEDPSHLAMQPGSCAQVQFIETSRRWPLH